MANPTLDVSIRDDGTTVLALGSARLRCGWPAIDHEPVRATRVEVERSDTTTTIRFHLDPGSIELRVRRDPAGLLIGCRLLGFERAPHWVHPLSGCQMKGFSRVYRTGIGFSGPSGIVDLPASPERFGLASYLCTGLGSSDGWLAVGALQHRDFLQKCHIENRLHRRQFRDREIDRNAVYFEAGFSTECISLPEGELTMPDLRIVAGMGAFDTMRSLAGEIALASGVRLTHPPGYHWCSWYRRGAFMDLPDLQAFLDGAQRLGEKLDAVQIDDGYCHNGDWLEPNARWPGGLEHAFGLIRERGYKPGVWVAPFMVGSRSKLAREHPDWLLHDADGSRVVEWRRYDGSALDEETYVLDSSHPDAMAYLRRVFTTLRGWGAQMFKTDFIEWGFRDSTRFRRATPGKSSMQHYRDFTTMVRESIGAESHWLACIAYFSPMIGFADSIRVSSDVGVAWNDNPPSIDGPGGGTGNVVWETVNSLYLNHTLWQNDPDSLFLRDHFVSLSPVEINTLALLVGISGTSVNHSEMLHDLPPDRLKLLRWLRPGPTRETARVPLLELRRSLVALERRYAGVVGSAVLVFNPTSGHVIERMSLCELTGLDSATIFAWSPDGATRLGERSEWYEDLPRHASNLYWVSPDGTPPPATLTLGGWNGVRS
jgi:hypothetical protein